MKNIHLFRIFLCFLFFASLLGQNLTASANAFDDVLLSDVSITSYINQYQTGENSPLQGTITISHDKRVMIDPLSFRLDNKPLSVEFVQDVAMSPNSPLILSIYQFYIERKPKGLYLLPEIRVKVGDKEYRSLGTSYEVKKYETNDHIDHAIALRLESLVDGPKVLYAGQHTRLVYRFYFNGDIELTTEKLPLLDAKGFRKIGNKEIRDYKQGLWSVQEISQEVEAITPGEFAFGDSVIEGNVYWEEPDRPGKRVYSHQQIKAESASLSLTVQPFPIAKQPVSFNGAVGEFSLLVSKPSHSNIHVGDKIELFVDIKGTLPLDNLSLFNLSCQPGFSGRFQLSDLPVVGKINGNNKRFIVELRPLSSFVTAIPPIEFSFFNPNTALYTTLRSQEIPIEIESFSEPEKTPEIVERLALHSSPNKDTQSPLAEQPVTIKENYTVNVGGNSSSEQRLLDQNQEHDRDPDSRYREGRKAQTIAVRKEAFNQALSLYRALESRYDFKFGNGELYYNIGNTYFQLEEYAMALFYYYRAVALRPNDDNVLYNLNAARSKLDLSESSTPHSFFFLTNFSPLRIIQLLALFTLLLSIGISFYKVMPKRSIKIVVIAIAIGWIWVFCHLLYRHYIQPVEGVIIQATYLQQDADKRSNKVTNQPIQAGVKVIVLEMDPTEKWMKIRTPHQELGYLPQEKIRLI